MAIGCLGDTTVGLKSGISEFTEVRTLQDNIVKATEKILKFFIINV
jgi:hypothetical protein